MIYYNKINETQSKKSMFIFKYLNSNKNLASIEINVNRKIENFRIF